MADTGTDQQAPSATASVSVMNTPAAQINIPTSKTRNPQLFVASFVLIAFLGVILLMCWHVVPAENKDMLETLIGFIGGAFTAVVAFYFGSTSSSHAKDAAISALSGAPPST